MKLSQLIARVKRQIPQATSASFPDSIITAELNHACDECNLFAQVYKGYTDFTATIGQSIYSISEKVPNYLTLEKSGVWLYTTAGKSKWLFPKSRRWFDIYIRNWRDQANSEPAWYWVQGDELGLWPPPLSANTIRVHHLMKATPMSANDNYPWWDKTTEMSSLRAMDNAIVAYAVWKLMPGAMDKEGRNYYEEDFFKTLQRGAAQIKRRPDIATDWDFYIRPDITQYRNNP